jgi:hypothetical protein
MRCCPFRKFGSERAERALMLVLTFYLAELMLFYLFGDGLLAIDVPGVDTLGRVGATGHCFLWDSDFPGGGGGFC